MCNLYSITTNQEAIRRLFRQVNRYVGNLAPMPGVFPDYALGDAGSATDGGTAGHEYSEYIFPALASVASAGAPVPGAVQQLCRICPRAESRNEEKGRSLVCAKRRSTA